MTGRLYLWGPLHHWPKGIHVNYILLVECAPCTGVTRGAPRLGFGGCTPSVKYPAAAIRAYTSPGAHFSANPCVGIFRRLVAFVSSIHRSNLVATLRVVVRMESDLAGSPLDLDALLKENEGLRRQNTKLTGLVGAELITLGI